MTHSIISQTLEKRFSLCYNRKIVNDMANFAISRNFLYFSRQLHKRHKLFHQIKLIKYKDKFLNRHIQVSLNEDPHCLLKVFGVYLVVLTSFFKHPALNVELLLVFPNILHLLFYCLYQFFILFINDLTALI
jgi:hypothetical protein